VSLQAIAGPYQKHKPWVFTPATGDSIKLGRSKSKKMVKEGVSLSRDGSVSTQHGKLEVRGGVILYTDTQSSNGSILNGTEIEHHSPATLNSGDELILGDTAFEITIEKL